MSMPILLIEDNHELASLITDFLESEGFELDYACDGLQAINLIEQNPYRMLLLDLNLPRLDGLSVCRWVRERFDELPIIMLTARDTIEDSLEGFSMGADDYLTKPFDLRLLLARMESVTRRYKRTSHSKSLNYEDLSLNISSRCAVRGGTEIKLTPIACKILEKLLWNSPEPVARAELEMAIYGDDLPENDVLRYHIYHLRKLIDKPFDRALIQTVPKKGYRLV